MACSSPDAREGGFATSAAMITSMGLAMVISAVTVASISELQHARADNDRMSAEQLLAGLQHQAALDILHNQARGRLSWRISGPNGPAAALAEPEADKAGLAIAAEDEDGVLPRFKVANLAAVRASLGAGQFSEASQEWLRSLSQSRLWRDCAPSMISRFGQAKKLILIPATAPMPSGFAWRAGEVWRVRVRSAEGWVDDRVVRFTGDDLEPAATLERRFFRTDWEDAPCDALIARPA